MPGPEVAVIARATRPSRAQNHADGGQFIFRLHDGEGRLAVLLHAVLLHVVDQVFDRRSGRRDGVQATTVTPANSAPSAAAELPSIRILPSLAFIGSTERYRVLPLVSVAAAYS